MDGARWQKRGSAKQGNAHGGGVTAAAEAAASGGGSGARRKGSKGVSGKNPRAIKLVYIGNPVRVTTTEAGFRALVQELTGRHADPSKYSGGGGGGRAVDDGADDSSGASQSHSHRQAEPQLGAVPSPVSTEGSSDAATGAAIAAAAASCHVPSPARCYDDDDFAPQLIDNSYSVFSPPTFLSGPHCSDM